MRRNQRAEATREKQEKRRVFDREREILQAEMARKNRLAEMDGMDVFVLPLDRINPHQLIEYVPLALAGLIHDYLYWRDMRSNNPFVLPEEIRYSPNTWYLSHPPRGKGGFLPGEVYGVDNKGEIVPYVERAYRFEQPDGPIVVYDRMGVPVTNFTKTKSKIIGAAQVTTGDGYLFKYNYLNGTPVGSFTARYPTGELFIEGLYLRWTKFKSSFKVYTKEKNLLVTVKAQDYRISTCYATIYGPGDKVRSEIYLRKGVLESKTVTAGEDPTDDSDLEMLHSILGLMNESIPQ